MARFSTRSMVGAMAAMAVVVALGVVPVAAQPAQPGAGTVVFVRDGDVWMTDPAGSAEVRVTSGGGWRSPSMADDGTIAAVFQDRSLATMDRTGALLTPPFEPAVVLGAGIEDARIAPDGEMIAYGTAGPCPEHPDEMCQAARIVAADGTGEALGGADGARHPAWLPAGRIVVHGGLGADLAAVGAIGAERWFAQDDPAADEPYGPLAVEAFSVNRGATTLALHGEHVVDGATRRGLWFATLDEPPPASPTLHDRCVITQPSGQVATGVSLDPHGTNVVYAQGAGATPADVGRFDVIISDGFDPAVCGGSLRILASDGQEPFWAAVPFDPDPAPMPSRPPAPDDAVITLTDGDRVDGGGAADPVGQALATSQAVWGEATAPRVVLATAADFPDALAGAALAGEMGPILVTPFGPDLDPRVEAEIARVTGGQGMVLVLGGAQAVTDGAAAQARAAAGSPSCAAPFPPDCRYAGTGREHTAALVGETVLAVNDGSGGRALLARGDAFADAITGGAYAAEAGVPILLTPSEALHPVTEQFVRDHGITEVIVLGGTAAVSDAAAAAVPAPTRRVAGDDRTATSAAIARDLWHAEGLSGGGIVAVNVRDGRGWPAALAAAVVSAMANAPQLGLENPPAGAGNPGAAVLSAAQLLGSPVVTHAPTDLVGDDHVAALREAARGGPGGAGS